MVLRKQKRIILRIKGDLNMSEPEGADWKPQGVWKDGLLRMKPAAPTPGEYAELLFPSGLQSALDQTKMLRRHPDDVRMRG